MPATNNPFGDFLRASRARVDPGEAGLITGGSRRVAGLRREEVAVLAGVSADYYARLEQGRERNPSAQVVDAVGRALRLDADARGHLFRLAGLAPFARWPAVAEATVHALRLNAGLYPQDPGIRALVDELLTASDAFRSLWNDQTVGGLQRAFKVFEPPVAGRIELTYQTFDERPRLGRGA